MLPEQSQTADGGSVGDGGGGSVGTAVGGGGCIGDMDVGASVAVGLGVNVGYSDVGLGVYSPI